MSTTELSDKIKTLPLEDRKEVLRILSEELEKEVDARLNERKNRTDERLARSVPRRRRSRELHGLL
jgi:hypothetical protein